jgi:hypothetical protein
MLGAIKELLIKDTKENLLSQFVSLQPKRSHSFKIMFKAKF